ncbi:hypothetical protein ACO22_04427 [Paracoccidioides brasiliensis]|uniref:Septation initiation network scaffold protein cdc11 n=1 Tax=Paracoccidioides brasiliensis TaxID=121759 RepID=A0A1D2JD49_PARBR|nr:hypothetical protein ACO22_04427 [Paracoccidioides brasiliensis]
MSKQPWLDDLSQDWIPQPCSSQNSLRERVSSSFKRSSRSQSASPPPTTSISSSQKPSFNYLRHMRKSSEPSRLSDIEPSNSNLSSNHSFSIINVLTASLGPKVSVQVQSDSPVESSTMQIKPRSKIVPAGDAPEWKKRLLLGKAPVGEGGDLFGPMELENVFKPPPPTAEPTTQTNILTSIQAKHPASVPLISSRDRIPDNSPNGIDGTQRGKPADGDQDSMERYNTSVDKAKCSFGYIQGSGSLGFDPRSRTLSGREELRNEEITPILFSKDETAREHTSRTFLESILDRGKSSVVTGKEGLYSRRRDSVVSDDYSYLSHRGEQTFSNGTEQTVEMTSQSLPEDLSVGTTDFVSVGGLISMRRGGHSNDGSFRHRQLTPSLLSTLHSSSFLSGSKLRNSPHVDRRKGIFPPQQQLKQHHQNQQSPSKFLTPYRERRETNDSRPRSSGSPLKLFGEYDTFTNNKLLRRMSQFEETYNNGPEDVQSPPSENRQRGGSQSRPTSRRNNQTTSSFHHNVLEKSRSRVENPSNSKGPVAVDIHSSTEQREEGLSLLPAPSLVIAQEDGNGPADILPQRKHSGENESQNKATVPTDLFGPTVVTTPSFPAYKHNTSTNNAIHNYHCESNMFRQSETKRVLNSPSKDPCRKRRRTLQNIDPNNQILASSILKSPQFSASCNLQSNQNSQKPAVSNADRVNLQLLPRPRTPTPSQTRSQQASQENDRPIHRKNPSSLLNVQNEENKPEDKLSFIASPSHVFDDSRKGSITTQDFLNEATKIMDIIRARGRNNNIHDSLSNVKKPNNHLTEASEADPCDDDDESTQEEFSRPASREGVDLRKLREPRQQNPRIVSHLKKFEDEDDFELYMGGSVMSLHLDREQNAVTHSIERQDANGIESNSENIKIRERLAMVKVGGSAPALPGNSNSSGTDGQQEVSSQRSLQTSSSRGSSSSSGAKGIISSDMIAHLIPEQVGAMTYDRSAHTWVKGGDTARSDERPASNLEGDISEEDPFKSIPDLSVDELQELMAAQTFSSPAKSQGKLCSMTATYGEHGSRRGQHAIEEAVREEERREIPDFRPLTRDGRFETSSVQSKSTRFTSSCPKPDTDTDTRATSWSSEEMAASMHVQQASTDPANFLKRVDDIKWKRGQVRYPQQMDGGQVPGGLTSPRVATISFSSPLLSHVVYQEDSTSPVESEQPPLLPVPRHGNISGFQSQSGTVPCSYMKSSPFKTSSRHNGAFDIRAFMGRPISRIDEQTEDSANEDFHVENHGLSVMQVPGHEEQSMVLPGCPDMDTTYSFHLAPLSDFSLNQMDESMRLEVSYIAERTHPSSLRQVHGTFALATQDLVKHITDTEPYEPYWEHLRRLDLRGKGLITLHRLKDFCSRLEELDASDNNIGQVSGVPSSVRSLKIPCNCLTNLTSWGHLGNLQYLDVSGNKLEDLDAFAGLVHLRSLKADGNRIRNIRGVMGLNGLLTLNVRGNLVREVDFGEGELTRLINLDMRDNRISSVRNIRFIKTIEKLDLRGNQIQHFESNFPNLHLLYADKNHLSTITGLEQCHYLDVLSLREQSLPSSSQQSDIDRLPVIDFDISAALSLRKLYLSSNLLSPDLLAPPGGCPSLQFLDIASCALQELPSQFGMCFPNLRVLNLNFNALADVGELLGLRRLGRVSLIGNRIARLRRLCQILRSVGGRCGALTDVDLRENPITLGFYPAPVTGSGRMWRDEAGRLVGAKKHKYKRLHVHGHSGEERQLQVRGRDGENEDEGEEDVGFMSLGGCTDIARKGFRESRVADDADSADGEKVEIEIDDQYTVPPANIIADRKYVMHLDEATRLRRRVVELMVQAAAAGRLKVFNGLPVCGGDDGDGDRGRSGCVRKDEVWRRLEELGVLKKRRRTVQLEVGG